MSQPQIQFHDVQKEFYLQEDRTFKEVIPNLTRGKKWAKKLNVFSDVSFELNQGESVALIGENGAGKSTMLKLIARVTYPTKGDVNVVGRVAPLIELGAGFHHELSGHENIFLNAAILGMHKQEIEEAYQDILKFSELDEFIHVPIKRYSTGMTMRLAFSVAIHTHADILLIDEVLAVGDVAFQKKCLQRLEAIKKSGEKILIFVSHDKKSVLSFCERGLYLAEGELVMDDRPEKIYQKYGVD